MSGGDDHFGKALVLGKPSSRGREWIVTGEEQHVRGIEEAVLEPLGEEAGGSLCP